MCSSTTRKPLVCAAVSLAPTLDDEVSAALALSRGIVEYQEYWGASERRLR